MANSESFCMGLLNNIIHEDDYCSVRGLTVNHKIIDSEKMRSTFAKTIDKSFRCDENELFYMAILCFNTLLVLRGRTRSYREWAIEKTA